MRTLVLSAAVLALALASGGAAPASVTIAGSFQTEAGCPGDWDPTCAATALVFDASDGVWQGTLSLPPGDYEYKAALDGSWDVNYGAQGELYGANLRLVLPAERAVRFYYDDASHWVTDEVGSLIVTAPGSFQSELGCPGDWQPDCLRSWLQDVDGDGIYLFETAALPAGTYETKAAIREDWTENYGAGGVPNGATIAFAVPASGVPIRFRFDGQTKVLTVPEPAPPALAAAALLGLLAAPARAMLRAP